MKEQNNNIQSAEIKWPALGTVNIDSNLDFVYIMRKDSQFAMPPIAENVSGEYLMDKEIVTQILLEQYDTYFSNLTDILKDGYSSKGKVEIHVFDPQELDNAVRCKSVGYPIISLDPLMDKGVYQHKVSRGYFLSGIKDYAQIPRPGAEKLTVQAQNIAIRLNGQPACVTEDDIFSGGSVIASLEELISYGVTIQKVIPGIQIGQPTRVTSEMNIEVDSVVKYQTTDGSDIFDKVDLGDPRDYMLGVSGLVVKLPNNNLGRAPYILPFVSTAVRAGIPEKTEKDFALKILQANRSFFAAVEEQLGKPLLLKHMNPDFVVLMNQMYGIDVNTELTQIAEWCMNNIDALWETTKEQGALQERLAVLNLPPKIVFVDVNGTIIPDGSKDGYISDEDIQSLKNAVTKAKEKGFSIGLCSDSPLEQLQIFADKLDLDGPIIAENGNLIAHDQNQLIVNPLNGVEEFKKQIQFLANQQGFKQIDNSIAPEFGGIPFDSQSAQWAFGANRNASVTVFGPKELIYTLGIELQSENKLYSIDCSPEYNFFAIHAGENYTLNKGKTFDLLSAYGYTIIMIGNSMSDWVEPDEGVVCTFVGASRINSRVLDKAAYVSDKPVIKGVIDILEQLT